ncbi:MAG: sulfatase-like hydrolase/transferase, partial [Micromonosporaceae bacterium]|nr:sulfatase-like hydrolase/transferase [Micromonosporaceae bacterium]
KINHNGTVKKYGTWDSEQPKHYQTDVLRRLAVNYLDRKASGSKPFFLSVAPLAPHVEAGDRIRAKYGAYSPRPAPRHKGAFSDRKLPRPPSFDEPVVRDKPRHIRKFDRMSAADTRRVRTRYRAQLESLLAVDEMVGAIVKKLRDSGELANTTIMFTSDNGYFNGEHRIRTGKIHPYEPSIRVPLIIRGPGFPAGRTIGQAVSNVDWAPTIMRAARARAGLTMDGRPVQELVRDPKSGDWRQLLFETGPKGKQRWYAAVRGARYKYIKHSNGEVELYDRKKDPHELASRHADPAYRDVRARLAKRLKELRHCSGRSCWGLRPASGKDDPVGEPIDNPPETSPGAATASATGGGSGGEAEGPEGDTGLPVTGLALGGLLALGGGTALAGIGLRAVKRRRRADAG